MANDMVPANGPGQNNSLAATPEVSGSGERPVGAGFYKASLGPMLGRNRKLLLFAAAGLMLAAFLSMVLWSAKTPYQTLYAGMDAKSAAGVVEYLQKEHIPYQLQGAGTVMVPADQVYAARLKLAGQDIAPGGGNGFELFDKKAEFGISDFAQQVNYQRAMQGELARTIEVLPLVSAARVHIVLAKESAFADRKREATASVMLKLTGSQHLSRQNVQAIQNLVAASVPGLNPSAVTIVDAAGNLLSRDEEQATLGAGQSLQETQSRIEQRLEARITGMLEQVVGEGQAVVRVTAVLNRQMSEQNRKTYNPDEQVVRSQKEASESRSSSDSMAQGVPGTASNTPGADAPTGQAAPNPTDMAKRNERTVNYEISSITEHKVIPSGGITRISVAAIVGGSLAAGDEAAGFQPRSKSELKTLQGLIEKAIGYDEDRGDSVEIQSMPLVDIGSTQGEENMAAQENKAFYLELSRYGLAGLAMLLLAFFILRPLAGLVGADSKGKKEADEQAAKASLMAIGPATFAHLENMEQTRHAIQHQPDRAGKIVREWVEQV